MTARCVASCYQTHSDASQGTSGNPEIWVHPESKAIERHEAEAFSLSYQSYPATSPIGSPTERLTLSGLEASVRPSPSGRLSPSKKIKAAIYPPNGTKPQVMKPSPSGPPPRSKVYAVKNKIGSLLDQSITRHFMSTVTDQNGKFIAEYVWIGGTGADMRSKGRTLPLSKFPKSPEVSPPPPLLP